MRTIKVIIPIS